MTRSIAAQSSLSHWTTVRWSIVACSMGTTSPMGRSARIIPPEWMPRWRGEPSRSPATSRTWAGTGDSSASGRVDQRLLDFENASCWPGAKPRLKAESRIADFAR